MITFGVLGVLTVHRDGRPVPLRTGMLRRLLAVLLCQQGQPISAAELAEEIWDGAAPATARKTVQVYVHRLRQALNAPDRIAYQAGGYALPVARSELDALGFVELAAAARTARRKGFPEQASGLFHEALDMWRGEPYADVAAGPLLAAQVHVLAELRLLTQVECIGLDLDLARHAEQVTRLLALSEKHPYREDLRAYLMLALYRCGRQAEALQVFRDSRALFADQLGVEPGPALQQLHGAILRLDRRLAHLAVADLGQLTNPTAPRADTAEHSKRVGTLAPKIPAQLPADTAFFTGREVQLRQLDALIKDGNAPAAVVISTIAGTAGIGKTSLAVHWAHRVAPQFPDGQLYVNLRGFDPAAGPVPASEAIRGFLDCLTGAPQEAPTSLQAQAALYRTLLAGRRCLVLLDNASDADQVRPLLPGSPGSLALVTSRNQLPGLAATEGARPVMLDLLAPDEAHALLAKRLGAGRVAAEPEAAAGIIDACAGLPLALSIAAARCVANPEFPLAAVAAELRAAGDRLDALTTGDPASDVRSVFSWSYRTLGPDAARLFRLLGIHPGPDVSAAAAASLAGTTLQQVRHVLAELTRAHLLAEPSPARFTFHDLLRAYAAELAHAIDSEPERRSALGRVLDYYLHTANAATRLLYPHRYWVAIPEPGPDLICTDFTDYDQALDWFVAEHPVLLAAIGIAAESGFDRHAWQLTWTTRTYLDRRGHWYDKVGVHKIALEAVRRLGDLAGEAHIRWGLGVAYTFLSRYEEAHQSYQRSFELFRTVGDGEGMAHAHLNRSLTFDREGRYDQALGQAQASLDLFRALDHRSGQAKALNAVGWFQALLGRNQDALVSCQQAITLVRQIGDRYGEAQTWDSLGYAHHQLGQHRKAIACYQRALTIWRDLADSYWELSVLDRLGDTHLAADDPTSAWRAWHDALDLADQVSHPRAEQIRTKVRRLEGEPPS